MRILGILAILCTAGTGAFAQGAIVETYDQLSKAPAFVMSRGTLPGSADISSSLPKPRSQAGTATCVSWAVTYAAGSQALRRAGRADMILSPSYTYNQLTGDVTCQTTTSISKTLDLLKEKGGLPISEFAFDAGWCGRVPTQAELQRSANYKIKGWKRINAKSLDLVKAALNQNIAVIFAMRPGQKFFAMRGDAIYKDAEEPGRGHAMVLVGYDDAKQAFRVQNSVGSTWGNEGYGWISYEIWSQQVDVGFIID